VCSICVLTEAGTLGAGDRLARVRLSRAREGFAVSQALQAAERRLALEACQAVFSDFAEASGRSLRQVLDEQGRTGTSQLGSLLFYDGADAPACRPTGVLAFTAPGSHVVRICGARFKEAFETNPARAQAVVIHEMLHSLGLGENPPSSREITAQVMKRCL
jgi:hypothetical protein